MLIRELKTAYADHLGDVWAFASYCVKNNHDVSSITENGKSIANKLQEILPLLEDSEHTQIIETTTTNIVDELTGWRSEYVPTKMQWKKSDNIVTHQLSGGKWKGELKNPPQDVVDSILTIMTNLGFEPIEVGGHLTLLECIQLMVRSVAFVGIDSGMSHVAHSVGVPMILVEHKLDFSAYHQNKAYEVAHTSQDVERLLLNKNDRCAKKIR